MGMSQRAVGWTTVWVIGLLAWGPTPAAAQAPSFRGLGDLPGGAAYSEAWGLSGNGAVAVGGSTVGGSGIVQILAGFAWTESGGLVPVVDELASGGSARAFAASADGSVIVGVVDYGAFSALGVQAFVWVAGEGWDLIGDLPGGVSGVPKSYLRGVSADGWTGAGIGESASGTEAFHYSRLTGELTALGDLPGGPFGSYAYGISADGGTIVGISYSGPDEQQAFRWTAANGMVGLGFLPPQPGLTRYSVAEAVSADGTVIVGESRSLNSGNGGEACRWVVSGGEVAGPVGIGDLPGGAFQSWAYGVSADGRVIVGRASIQGTCGPFGCGSAGRPFIWDAVRGMRDVQAILTGLGVAGLQGWQLTEARGVSADGTVIVGTGFNPAGAVEAWLAVLPRPCEADADGNGQVQPADVNAFINAWFAGLTQGTALGDFDANGRVEPADVNAFINAWFAAVTGGACV
jgi:probable HAF family extracellular repeat protein